MGGGHIRAAEAVRERSEGEGEGERTFSPNYPKLNHFRLGIPTTPVRALKRDSWDHSNNRPMAGAEGQGQRAPIQTKPAPKAGSFPWAHWPFVQSETEKMLGSCFLPTGSPRVWDMKSRRSPRRLIPGRVSPHAWGGCSPAELGRGCQQAPYRFRGPYKP